MTGYVHGHHESVLASHRIRTAANSAAYLLPHLNPQQSLLDVGSGPGTITVDLARRVGRVTALEHTETALQLTRDEAARQGVELDHMVGDVHDLDLPDDSFDVVHAHQVLQHVHDPVRALGELRRVCRPGGIVAVRDSDYHGFVWFPADPVLDRWLELYDSAARERGGEPDAGRHLLGWARAAGFTDVTVTSSTWCWATPESRRQWGDMWAERIRRSAIADQLRERGVADGELDEVARAWQRWAAAPDGWMSILHGELLARA
ncbi:class I SAM-dependent methyltransferase [Microlunatus sp. Y2014]|uniref:class I SAM-dependent methyltransferase n=1 Tax=Microlunatus sp. Y2014 TaxID=3418488 RepID=UPI003DA70AC8